MHKRWLKKSHHSLIRNVFVFLFLQQLVAACTNKEEEKQVPVIEKPVKSTFQNYASKLGGRSDLRLVTTTDHHFSIEGCISGYTATIDSTFSSLNFYKGDLNCIAKLLDFSYKGKVYTPEVGFGFSDWQVGDQATFVSGDGMDRFKVEVSAQLSSPIAPGDKIDYLFFKIESQTVNTRLLEVAEGNTDKIGSSYPSFAYKSSTAIDFDGSVSTLKFSFVFECTQALSDPTDTALVSCAGVNLNQIDYILVADTFENQPCTETHPQGCSDLFTSNTPKSIDTTGAELIQPGAQNLVHGGFATKLNTGDALQAPDNISANSRMVLLLRNNATNAFHFYNLDVVVEQKFGAPEFFAVDLANEAEDDYINAADALLSNDVIANPLALNYTQIRYALVPYSTTCDGLLSYNLSFPTMNDAAFAGDGEYKVCVQVNGTGSHDPAYGQSFKINLKKDLPQYTSMTFDPLLADGHINLSDHNAAGAVLISVTAADYDLIQYAIMEANDTCDATQTFSESPPLVTDSAFTTNGSSYRVCLELSDYAQNPKTYAAGPSFVYDIEPPTLVSVDASAWAADGYINASEYSLNEALINIVASGYAIDNYTPPLVNSPPVVCDGNQTYSLPDRPLITTLPAVDNSYVVCVQLIDAVNNITYGTSPVIQTDLNPPSGVVAQNQADGFEIATLNWTQATETASGFDRYIIEISDASDFSNIYYSNEITLISTSQVTTTGLLEGLNYWRIRVRDNAMNEVTVVPADPDFNVTLQPPVMNIITDRLEPASPIVVEELWTFDLTNTNINSDINVTYTCVYDQVLDDTVSPGADCTALPGIATFGSTTGILNWTPSVETLGHFELYIEATNAFGTDTQIIQAQVQQAYVNDANLMVDLAATFASTTSHGVNPLATWRDLTTNANNGVLNNFGFTTGSGWEGDGTRAAPYALTFDGSNDFVQIPNQDFSGNEMTFSLWLKPLNLSSSNGETILGINAASASGLRLSQSTKNAERLQLKVGDGYQAAVLASSPDFYWRLNETSGTTAVDLGSNTLNGSYIGGPTLASKEIIDSDVSSYVEFIGDNNQRIEVSNSSLINTGTFNQRSIELWFQADSTTNRQILYEEGGNSRGHNIYIENGFVYVTSWSTSFVAYERNAITGGQSYHVALVFDSTNRLSGYLNGVRMADTASGSPVGAISSHSGGIGIGGANSVGKFADSSNSCNSNTFGNTCPFDGLIGELALYNRLLSESEILDHFQAGNYICETFPLINGEWIYLGGRIDSNSVPNRLSMHVNSTQVCDVPIAGSFAPGIANIFLGSDSATPTANWNGSISSFKLYNVENATAVSTNFVATSNSFDDLIPPNFVSLNGINQALDGYLNASEVGSGLTLFSLVANGYATVDYTPVMAAPLTCDAALSYTESDLPLISDIPASDGSYEICVRLVDENSNTTYGKSATIVRDTVDPIFTSMTAINEALDGFIDLTETGAANPIFALAGTGYDSQTFTMILDDTPDQICDQTQSYSSSTMPLINSTPPVDDEYIVCVRLIDSAGNVAYGKSDIVERVANPPPVFTSIDLVGVVADTFLTASEKLAGTQIVGNPVASNFDTLQYAVVEGTTICDDQVSYAAEVLSDDVIFDQDGAYKVCIEVAAENETTAYGESQAIVFDTNPPSSILLTNEPDGSANITLEWSQAVESLSGFAHYGVEIATDASFINVVASQVIASLANTFYQPAPLAAGTYYWRLSAADLAGNEAVYLPADPDFTIVPLAPVLTSVASVSHPNGPEIGVALLPFDVDNNNTLTDLDMTYECYFDRNADSTVAATYSCDLLPGKVAFDTAAGVLEWTPGYGAGGIYEIEFRGTNPSGTDAEQFTVSVRPTSINSSTLFSFDASLANGAADLSGSSTSTWTDTSTNLHNASLMLFGYNSASGWNGTGSVADPFHLVFDGVDDHLEMITPFASNQASLVSLWFSPGNAASTAGENLLQSGFQEGQNGLVIRQSTTTSGALDIMLGPGYASTVLASSPDFYWRLDDASTGTLVDIGPNAHNGSYSGSPNLQQPSLLPSTANHSVEFTGTQGQIAKIPDHPSINLGTHNNRSIELWFIPHQTEKRQILWEEGGGTRGHGIYIENNQVQVVSWRVNSAQFYKAENISAGNLYHVVLAFNRSAAGTSEEPPVEGYLNGERFSIDGLVGAFGGDHTQHTGNIGIGGADSSPRFPDGSSTCNTTIGLGNDCPFDGLIDEVSLYNRTLTAAEVQSHYYAGVGGCTTQVLSNNQWYHLGVVLDTSSTQLSVLLNGTLECQRGYEGGWSQPTSNLYVGASNGSGSDAWQGKIGSLHMSASESINAVISHYDENYPVYHESIADISGLSAWFRNTNHSVVKDGSNRVQYWFSNVGQGEQFEQSGTSLQPVYLDASGQANLRPTLSFNGSDQHMFLNQGVISVGVFSHYIVLVNNDSATAAVYLSGNGSPGSEYGFSSTQSLTTLLDGGSTDSTLAAATQGSLHTLGLFRDGANKVDGQINLGGLTRLYSDAAQAGNVRFDWIGSDSSSGSYFNGEIAEVIFFESILGSADRLIVENYLRAKYNLP